MKLILMLVLPFALLVTGCTKGSSACGVQETFETQAVDFTASKLACANKDAMRADLDSWIAKSGVNLCKEQIIGTLVCPSIARAAVSGIVGGVVPAKWGCTGGDGAAGLETQLTALCEKIIP